jgi:hypothetical protein
MTRQPNLEPSIPPGQPWGGCRLCRHFRPDITCDAFPERIPLRILSAELDHLVVRPGQVGSTVFEVVQNPSGLARRLLEGAAKRGEPWAIEAVANAERAGAR